jgi:hypothetical protein
LLELQMVGGVELVTGVVVQEMVDALEGGLEVLV